MKERKNITFIAVVLLLLSMLCINFISPTTAATPKINATKKTLVRGQSYKLKITGTTRSVKWSSSNKKIATVKKDGKHGAVVKTKRTGKVTITAKIGSKRLKCRITVKSKGLNKTSLTLKTGQTTVIRMLNARGVKWYSSNKKIARITKTTSRAVRIKGMKAGKTYINGQIGKKKFRCRVTVKAKKKATSTAKTQKADGLYLYRTYSSTHPYYYRYYYKGKWYCFYELPRSTELALAKKSACFAEYFKYLAKYKKLISDNTEATLVAINHYAHDKGWRYDKNQDITYDLSRMFIYHNGVCTDFANAVNYLCYLSGVDAVVLANYKANHAISAIKYKGKWYHLESQSIASENDIMGYYNRYCNLDDHYMSELKTALDYDNWYPFEIYKFGDQKTASGHIPTEKELLASSGTPELKNVFHIDYRYSFSYESLAKAEANPTYQPSHDGVLSLSPHGTQTINVKRIGATSTTVPVENITDLKSSNTNVVTIYKETIFGTTHLKAKGIIAGTAVLSVVADGHKISWQVTVR